MKSVWRALIWKEWHEHKWKLVALTAILISMPALTLLSEYPSSIFTAVTAMLWLAVPILSIYLAANAASAENSSRTMPFLQSMPISMTRAAVVKITSAILTVCIAIVFVIAFAYTVNVVGTKLDSTFGRGIDQDRAFFLANTSDWYLSRFLLGSLAGTSLVIWVAAVGVNQSDEVRVGALGLLAIVSYAFLLVGLAWWFVDFTSPSSGFPAWFKAFGAMGPCGPVVLMWLENPDLPQIPSLGSAWRFWTASAVSHAALAGWYITRFGRISQSVRRSERTAAVGAGEWLAPPRRTRIGALIWKQFRESGPLALIAMCLMFATWGVFATALLVKVVREDAWAHVEQAMWPFAESIFTATAVVWTYLGFFVALVAGIGVFF